MQKSKNQVVFTNKAKCLDCYRCIRVCPVKAIRMKQGQASVIEELCIDCGTCIRNCPQEAKTYRKDYHRLDSLLENKKVAVSIAPSFRGLLSLEEIKSLPSVLRHIGFSYVSETAVGAYFTSLRTNECFADSSSSVVAGACPAVVNYIEKYRPDLLNFLADAASPMVLHARILKELLGEDTAIVFVGPCIAKKSEASREEYSELIDIVLTFDEFNEYLEEKNIKYENFEPSDFDDSPINDAKYYPIAGGLLKTSKLSTDMTAVDVVATTGFDELSEVLNILNNDSRKTFIEPLFCNQGCLNGPGIKSEKNLFNRRIDLITNNSLSSKNVNEIRTCSIDLSCNFSDKSYSLQNISEEEINNILLETGNADPSERLNCQACGYASCYDKAVAVARGMAETEMCIPFMRRKAESKSDKIIERSPNGIVILDEHLRIINMNPAFKKYFSCNESIAGKPISYLMDPEPFVKVATGQVAKYEIDVEHKQYGIICHEVIYELKENKQFVGVFVNITNNLEDRSRYDSLRENTINQAKELLEHQIGIAQSFAKLLGESTARGEALVENLMKFAKESNKR